VKANFHPAILLHIIFASWWKMFDSNSGKVNGFIS